MPLPVAVAPRVILVLVPRALREAALRCSAFATKRAFALEIFFVLGIAFSVGDNSITVLLPNALPLSCRRRRRLSASAAC
jgi:hypothetical protein